MRTDMPKSFKTIAGFIAMLAVANLVYAADQHSLSTETTPSEGLVTRSPDSVVDAYFNQITCDNKAIKLWQENFSLGEAAPMSPETIDKAFSSEIYYALPSGAETKGSTYLRETYGNVSRLMSNLRTLAMFFGHDVHNLYIDENNNRRSRGLEPLSKSDFLNKFISGEVIIRTGEIANLKDFLQTRIDEIESITRDMKYGCLGDRNFLYRRGSELAKSVSASAFLIPATAASLKVTSSIHNKATQKATSSTVASSNQTTTRTPKFKFYQRFLAAGVSKAALDEATAKYFKMKARGVELSEYRMVVVDYVPTSNKPRFWVLNLVTGNATGMLMSHGSGLGKLSKVKMPAEKIAFVSNVDESNASATGAMVLGGKRHRKGDQFKYPTVVRGLEAENANVYDRGIIIHEGVNRGNVYVDDQSGDRAGRSEGCFALSPENAKWVANNLGAGTFLYAYSGDIPVARTPAQARQALNKK